jgi:hypothetical protein
MHPSRMIVFRGVRDHFFACRNAWISSSGFSGNRERSALANGAGPPPNSPDCRSISSQPGHDLFPPAPTGRSAPAPPGPVANPARGPGGPGESRRQARLVGNPECNGEPAVVPITSCIVPDEPIPGPPEPRTNLDRSVAIARLVHHANG